jgi:tRNA-modifying protein YgfZ
MDKLEKMSVDADGGRALAVVRITGAHARAFLQGQLSNDLRLLGRDDSLLAALNTPQGRVTAIVRLIERTDGIHALLPRELAGATIERLRKYVLRAKVTLEPADELTVTPIAGSSAQTIAFARTAGLSVTQLPTRAARHWQEGDVSAVTFEDEPSRALLIGPAAAVAAFVAGRDLSAASWNDWRLAQIAAGEPQLYAATSERFVAQMLNLDLIGGLSFSKGCYTGQEIIVRTQHLGRIKRRMVRLRAHGGSADVGDKLTHGAETVAEVIEAARAPDGAELLAVVATANLAAGAPTADGITLERLPLAYTVGDEAHIAIPGAP